jgi:NAD-dependent DNA ligase
MMPSLNKGYPETISPWLDKQKGNVNVSDKLDGTSLQIEYNGGKPVFCATRGKGSVGGNVTFMIPHLKIPKKIGTTKKIVFRCEGIFSNTAFQKYKKDFDSARNAASGVMNRTSDNVHPATKNLDVVVVKVLYPTNLSPSQGLSLAKKLGMHTVPNKSYPVDKVTPEFLSKLLSVRKSKVGYALDGMVLTEDKPHPPDTEDKPAWSIAFKENPSVEDAPTATVEDVKWQVSRHGYLVPVIIISPTKFDGATVKRATANNAKWMMERGIGVGAQVKLVRSGEIIPKIVAVTKKAKFAYPSKTIGGDYAWDAKETHLVLTNPEASKDALAKRIVNFFKKLGVDFVAGGVATKLVDAGIDTPLRALKVTPQQLLKLPGFQAKSAQKVYDSIQSLFAKGALLPVLMEASGKFPRGLGVRRIVKIQKAYPNLMELAQETPKALLAKIAAIPSFSTITAQMFVDGIYAFEKWVAKTGINIQKPKVAKPSSSKLSGQRICWTGYRDASQEDIVTKNGGEVVGFNSKTTVLIYSPTGKPSSKQAKAKSLGIPMLTWDQFVKKFGLKG